VTWLNEPEQPLLLCMPCIWKELAGHGDFPGGYPSNTEDLHQAALVDGANEWQYARKKHHSLINSNNRAHFNYVDYRRISDI
jgi:hypothetical protein